MGEEANGSYDYRPYKERIIFHIMIFIALHVYDRPFGNDFVRLAKQNA